MIRILSASLLTLALGLAPAVATGAEEEPTKPAGITPAEEGEAKPFLGVVVRPSAEADFDGPNGLVVDRTFPRTTADDLGLQHGDVITRFNDQPVATREALKTVLESVAVGDTVTVAYLRAGETLRGAAELRARPTRRSVNQQLQEARTTAQELQGARAEQLENLAQAREEERTLAESMQELSAVLAALPEQLDQTARQFKAVYPDGEFTVDIDITIRSHPQSAGAIDLSPVAPPPSGEKPLAEAEAGAKAEQPETAPEDRGEATERPPAQRDGVMPPPTKQP